MALRNYMQDLLRAQTLVESHDDEIGCTVNITIVDDNSSSCLPEDDFSVYDLPLENMSFGMARTPETPRKSLNGTGVHGGHGFLLIDRRGDSEEISRGETNRIMLDDFRRRQRYLRETLSPKQVRHGSTLPNLKYYPIQTQWTPTLSQTRRTSSYADDDVDSSEPLPRDSQRGRMRRLKAQRNSSLPLV